MVTMPMFAAAAITTPDLISGASLIYSLVSALIGIILFLIWRLALEMKTDVKELFTLHRTCQTEMRKEFAPIKDLEGLREELKELREDRREKWKAFFAHKHNTSGRVEID